MPLDRLVLIIVCVLAAAAVTIYLGAALVAAVAFPPYVSLAVISIVALCAYIGWRVIAERWGNKDDDHYDRFEN
ncbi:MAG: hypothetical protein AAFP85_07020 [Pseudomonadota bacterium]